MSDPAAPPDAARGTAALLAGTIVAGVAAYAFLAVGTRAIGAAAFAPIPVLWTWWSFTVAILTIPVQHWIVRTVRAEAAEAPLRAALPAVWVATIALSSLTVAVAFVARQTLFDSTAVVFAVLAGIVPLGALAVGIARGLLVARHRPFAAGLAAAAESLVRVALAVVVALRGGGAAWYAVALVGGFVAVAAWPRALVPRAATPDPSATASGPGATSPAGSPFTFLAGVAGGSLLAQLVLTSGPIVLKVLGGPSGAVTALFAALSLFGAPNLMALGVAPQATKALTGLVVDGNHAALNRVRRAVIALAVVGTAAGGAFGALAGSALLRLFFGDGVELSGATFAMIGAGSTLALATLAQTLVLVALGSSRAVGACWALAAVAFVVVAVVPLGDPVLRVTVALVAAEALAMVALAGAAAGSGARRSRPVRRPTARPEPR